MSERKLELERMVFFCDAVVAIAITLLALDLKINPPSSGHLRFVDIGNAWHKFAAFALSFLNIAVFWRIHHQFYIYIKKIDRRFLTYNIFWLFFIVILPFSSSLISEYFEDTPAIFLYCVNTLLITLFQNLIWDHVAVRPDYLKEELDAQTNYDFRLSCNVAMVNSILAIGLSFISPLAAFIILFTRLPMINFARRFFKAPIA